MNLRAVPTQFVRGVNGHAPVLGYGDMVINIVTQGQAGPLKISNARYCPEAGVNLVATRPIIERGAIVQFMLDGGHILYGDTHIYCPDRAGLACFNL